jgi:hypothetical protein
MARIAMALEALSTTVSYYPSPITRASARAATVTGTDGPQQIPSQCRQPAPGFGRPVAHLNDPPRAGLSRNVAGGTSHPRRAHECVTNATHVRLVRMNLRQRLFPLARRCSTLRVPQASLIVAAEAQIVGYPDAIPTK